MDQGGGGGFRPMMQSIRRMGPDQFSGPVTTRMRVPPPITPPPSRMKPPSSIVEINVGGTIFTTRRATMLTDEQSLLALLFSNQLPSSYPSAGVEIDAAGRFFIDRSPTYFHHVIDFLRCGQLPPESEAHHVYQEATFYGITDLLDWCSRQAAVVSIRLEEQLRESMEEEYEQFKQAILQASQQHFTSAVQKNFAESRVNISIDSNQQGQRQLRTVLLLTLAPFPPANTCKKVHPGSPSNGLGPSQPLNTRPPRCESARFVVGDPLLASHQFSLSPQLPGVVDIALPYMPSKKLDLLYCLVSRHLTNSGMKLQLKQGLSSSGVKEIHCWDCGGQFPLYELHVSWGGQTS